MTRLPSALQPAWPLVKRLHRLASLLSGVLGRLTARFQGERGLPRRATTRSDETARLEPGVVTVHRLDHAEQIRREMPAGDPAGHWVFEAKRTFDVPARFSLEIERGVVVGDYGANLTPGGTLDYETSEYFGITSWREHPLFLRRRLPPIHDVEGTLVALATRGGSDNYYHFITDVLPRFGVFEETMPGRVADAIYVPHGAKYQRDLLEMVGLDHLPVVPATKHSAVRAERLVVPSLPNPLEVAPRATVEWLRSRLPAPDADPSRPRRLYVTRGTVPNTRRLVHEEEIVRLLEQRGFVRLEPGGMTVRDQLDTFGAADVVVAPHGAALTNLVFCRPGVRVLEMFPANYVNQCFWALSQSIPDSRYRYLVSGDVSRHGPGDPMNKIQSDIDVDPEVVAAAVDALLAD